MSTIGNTSFSHEQYEPIEEIGRGGMGVLLKCRDKRMDRDVAVKVLGWNFSNEAAIRFQQEAQALAQLRHPNIVNIVHFGHADDDSLFIVMELLNGKTLDLFIGNDELQFDDALNAFIQICDGLAHAHGKGILHRDIKPSNIFLERKSNGEIIVTITDFGLAKLLTEDQRLTKTGIGLGSPQFMSPEQIDGKMVDDRADIYSLGCLMFQILTGSPLFIGPNVQSVLLKHTHNQPPLLREQSPDKNLPEAMEQVISKCLRKNPDDRYNDVRELRNALLELQAKLVQSYATSESNTEPQPVLKIGDVKGSLVKTLFMVAVVLIPVAILVTFALNKFLARENPKTATRQIIDTSIINSLKISIESGERDFDLKDKPINDESLKVFSKCKTAERVDLSGTAITDAGLQHLDNSKILKLVLNDTAVSTLETLPGRDSLMILQLKGSQITDRSLLKLREFQKLLELDLRDTRVTVDGIAQLKGGKFENIETNPVTKKQFDELRAALPFCFFNGRNSLVHEIDLEIDRLLKSKKNTEAHQQIESWLKVAEERGDLELKVALLTLLAQCYDSFGQNVTAEKIWKEAIELGEKKGFKVRLINTYKFYIDRSFYLKKKQEVVKYGAKLVDLDIELDCDPHVAEITDAVGWRMALLGAVKEGMKMTEKAIELKKVSRVEGTADGDLDSTPEKKQLEVLRLETRLASMHRAVKQYDEAMKILRSVKSQLSKMDETFAALHICMAHMVEAQVEMEKKNYKTALELNDRAFQAMQNKLSKRNEALLDLMAQRSELLKALGRKQEANMIDSQLQGMRTSPGYKESENTALRQFAK